MLRALCTGGTRDWVQALPLAEFPINLTVAASTGHTPFETVYGTNDAVRLPIDNAIRVTPDNPAAEDVTTEVTRVVSRVKRAMERA